jgi:hypothetical protein
MGLSWSNSNIYWSNYDIPWSGSFGTGNDPSYVQPNGVDATTLVQPWLIEPWNPYTANDEHDKKRKDIIQMVVEGITYEQPRKTKKVNISTKNVKINVRKKEDIDLDVKIGTK